MKVYYITISKHKGIQGCLNKNKLEKLYPGYDINECDISMFKGYIHNSEWLEL